MASYNQTLSQLKVVDLKNILKQHQLEFSGKKNELIQRIVDHNIYVQTSAFEKIKSYKSITPHNNNDIILSIKESSLDQSSIKSLVGIAKYRPASLIINNTHQPLFLVLAARALEHNSSIKQISIETSDTVGLILTLNALQGHSACLKLNIDVSGINDEVIMSCVSLLTINTSLNTFTLMRSGKSNISCKNIYDTLAHALQNNKFIEKFELNLSRIEDGRAFANALKYNNTLRKLSLRHRFDENTWISFADAIIHNTSLYKLKLTYFGENNIIYDCDRLIPFLRSLPYHAVLSKLDLDVVAYRNDGYRSNYLRYTSAFETAVRYAFLHNGSLTQFMDNNDKVISGFLQRNRKKLINMNTSLLTRLLGDITDGVVDVDTSILKLKMLSYLPSLSIYRDIYRNNTKKAYINVEGVEQVDVVSQIIRRNTSINRISICMPHDYDLPKIIKHVVNGLFFSHLRRVDIQFVRIDDDIASSIAELIKTSNSIIELSITFSFSGPQGGIYGPLIYDAMQYNNSIIKLKCGWLHSDTAMCIGQMLRVNKTLKILKVSFSLNDLSGECIFDALLENSTLSALYIKGNRLADRSLMACIRLIKHNKALKGIDISFNMMGRTAENQLREAMSGGSLSWIKMHSQGSES